MATSSIFASFDIKDRKTAEAFAEALDISYNEPERTPAFPAPQHMTDKDKISEFFAKGKKKVNE